MGARTAAAAASAGESFSFFNLAFQNFEVVAVPAASLAYPLYASIKAIETRSPAENHQWLMYWVLYSIVALFELFFARLMVWFPLWPYMKLGFTCWLVIPYFDGAARVYGQFVRPYLVAPQVPVNLWYNRASGDRLSRPEDVLAAAEKYIQENGAEAFESMIHRSNRQASMSTRNYTSYDDNYRYDDDHRF